MSVDTITMSGSTVTFPKAGVEAKLRDAFMESAKSDASLKGIQFPIDTVGQAAALVHLDSLDVVSLLCDIEPLVGFELKDILVQAGGYNSINRAIEHLMPRIEKAWEKNCNKGGKK